MPLLGNGQVRRLVKTHPAISYAGVPLPGAPLLVILNRFGGEFIRA